MIKHGLRRHFHSLEATAASMEISQLPMNQSAINLQQNHRNFREFISSCTDINSLLQIHGRLMVLGVKLDDFLCTQLVNSYSKFHNSEAARSVFNKSSNPSVVLCNSTIRAYTRTGQHKQALELYHDMLIAGIEPDNYTFTFVLKSCTGIGDLEKGILIHREIVRRGLESDVFVATGLVDLYSKLGRIDTARQLFDRMPQRDIVTWNAMIAGFSQGCNPNDALVLLREMQLAHVEPNSVTLLNFFPAVCHLSSLTLCRSLHGFVVRRAFQASVLNGLVDLYSKCGSVEVARLIFDGMSNRDDVSWGTMIAGYAHSGFSVEALELFHELKTYNLKLNQVSTVSALMAAADLRDIKQGMDIHTYAIQQGIYLDVFIVTTLMTMYARCGYLYKAWKLFDEIREKDIVAWSAIIAIFVQNGNPEEGISLFRHMQSLNIIPNRVTIVSILPAFAELSALKLGKSIHCYVMKTNTGLDVLTGTALVSMYAKCGSFALAHTLFDSLPRRDVTAWNALINGYAQIGDAGNAMQMFRRLQSSGIQSDSGTMVGVLPACVLLEALDQGISVHAHIIKSGFDSDLHVNNAVIDMYAKCGSLSSAESLFDDAQFIKDVVSWNIMISGYAQNGFAKEAISVFRRMKSENMFRPNLVTIVSVLPAMAYLAALREGKALHSYIIKLGFESNILVGNSLIDIYAKCGELDASCKFFDRMAHRDQVSWNAMLAGYAIHGHGEEAVALFSRMREECVEVDSVSFICVLSACRHGGLVEQGRKVFDSMSLENNLKPNLEHYACMVDLLGRVGRLDEAWDFIQRMPMAPDAGVWGALLGACKMHSNVYLGEKALDNLVKIEPRNPAHFVVLSNIYAAVGRWGEVAKTRMVMNSMGFKKTPGCSWVEVKDTVHVFRVGGRSHPQFERIRVMWEDLRGEMEKAGYVPDTSCVLHNVEEEEKGSFLCSHSERLAITFGLLNTEAGMTIRVVKNLRVCSDCHTTTKFVSKITSRRIIVRDASRFHHFENGACSCKDYW